MVAIAYSGGRDSTALLHATLAAAQPLALRVLALHVHHGLSAHADQWLEHCELQCRRWAARGRPVTFAAERLTTRPAAGESVEAWARRERYAALARLAQSGGAGLVLLAHHRRDQAETFLLQALRGGGVSALSAMPASATREGLTWSRPWLATPDATIAAYARRHRLRWVEDDSNADVRFARNRLRAKVWPALTAAFPDAEGALARAAGAAQEAAAVVDALAADDVASVADGASLHLERWRSLPAVRRAPALRAWLQARCGDAPGSLVERLLVELDGAGARRWPAPRGELHSYRGRLAFEPVAAGRRRGSGMGDSETDRCESRAEPSTDSAPGDPTQAARALDLSRPGRHAASGWAGCFEVERVASGGMPLPVAAQLEMRARRPGDRFQAGPGRPARSLKLQFQAAGVPARQRTGPVLCHRDALVFVAGLGLDARALAPPGEAQVALAWRPD